MRIFMLWSYKRKSDRELNPHQVAFSLQKIFSPLFSTPPTMSLRQNRMMAMVFLELPVRGWIPPFFQEDKDTWAFSIDYPINVRSALASNGIHYQEDNVLPTLGRALQESPFPILQDMSPPFSLIWGSKKKGETYVQNDGLGLAQLFEYEDDQLWVITNKITALKALGVTPELDRDHWAVRSTLGSFALDQTGYKNTRFLNPTTQLRLDEHGIHRTTYDVLADWVNPQGLSRDDCLELARSSLLKQIKEVMPLWEKPTVGLSGGWDSRAVVSSLRVLGADVSFRVKGLPGKFDVTIASELAKIAGFDIKIRRSYGLPPNDVDSCRNCISMALLWQAGYMWNEEHKSFLWEKGSLDGGQVNVMGAHGEVGRGKYAKIVRAAGLKEHQYEEYFVQHLMRSTPDILRSELRSYVRVTIQNALRQASRYGLTGLAQLDFMFLYERVRRYNSASRASQTGLVIAPFLNPDYIRASYAYRALGGDFDHHGKMINPFQRYIIGKNAPDWVNIPYEKDLLKKAKMERKNGDLVKTEIKANVSPNWKKSHGKDYYDYALYWKEVGKPIIDEAMTRGGFWTEVFDPDRAKKDWHTAPDSIAMLYLIQEVLQR